MAFCLQRTFMANRNSRAGVSAMNTLYHKFGATSLLFVAALSIPTGVNAQAVVDRDQEFAARRAAILQQDQFITDDGVIVDQNDVVLPPSQLAAPARTFQTVGWRGRYYGRPYAGYYAAPRARYYARYPGYYNGGPYYSGYGYGYGGYYARPYGYGYRGYPYGGYGARVGPGRVFWR